jgi:two-component system cell cycle response regulator DivK
MSRILVVEDNPVNMKLVQELLHYAGHEVALATTVDEAFGQLALSPLPDLVLLDLHIPGGGGERVLQHIRADERLATLCVVAVTAQAMHGDRERVLRSGFDGYIAKPIQVRSFAAEIAVLVAAAHRPA